KASAQIRGHTADGARLAVEIEHRDVAFGRAVKFENIPDAKAGLEFGPHIRAHAIAESEAEIVLALFWVGRLIDQIAAEFAGIEENGTIVVDNAVPKMRRGKFAPQNQSAAVQQRGSHPAQTACRMVQWQGTINPVLRTRICRAGEGAHIELGSHMC